MSKEKSLQAVEASTASERFEVSKPDSATLDADRAKYKKDATSVLEVKHSKENEKLLNNPKREEEYEACLKTLNEEERRGCPSFVDLMKQIKEKSDETLDALRARTRGLRFVITVIRDEKNKIIGYRPGLIKATPEPKLLRDAANPSNLTGKHYDKVHGDLSPHGLRPPELAEYEALFAMRKRDGVLIDRRGSTLLNTGKRTNKRVPVPIVHEYDGESVGAFSNPDNPNAYLVSRPSVWGDDVLPKTA